MRTLLICFSQTGNTRKIADCIHEGITEGHVPCQINGLDEVHNVDIAAYDAIGLGSPVFYYQEPFNVRSFLETLPPLKDQPWFVFCTHGSVIGNFFPSVFSRLQLKGASVIGWFNSYADITVPYYPRPTLTSGHPDEIDMENARQFGRDIAKRISQGFDAINNPPKQRPVVSSEKWRHATDRINPEFLRQVLPPLTWDPDACLMCMTCADECPVNGIDLTTDPPRLQDPCIFCFRCVNTCPTLAMNADWTDMFAMAPSQYKAYREELDRAADQGLFRWLIDPDTVSVDYPLIQQRTEKIEVGQKKSDK